MTSNFITEMTSSFLYSPASQINKTHIGLCQNVYNFIHISFKIHKEENWLHNIPYTRPFKIVGPVRFFCSLILEKNFIYINSITILNSSLFEFLKNAIFSWNVKFSIYLKETSFITCWMFLLSLLIRLMHLYFLKKNIGKNLTDPKLFFLQPTTINIST